MKIIQSYWSKPSLQQSEDPNSRFKGGWLHQKYSFYSQALSCLSFKEFYADVELYTDQKGKELFIDALHIPYTKTHITLDAIDSYDSKLWALGKIMTYAAQNTPFIHADSDVYIWEKLPEGLTSSRLFSQNLEINFPAYQSALDDILKHFDWVPTEIINALYINKEIHAFNAGIIGGHDLDFFQLLKERVFKFIDVNSHLLHQIDVGIFNTIFEQQLGYAIAQKKQIPVQYYLDHVDSDFSQVINFHTVPFKSKYVHCIGYAKKSIFACEQLEARFKYHYPDFYLQLNQNLKTHFPNDNFESDFSNQRFEYLFTIYDWLNQTSLDGIFNTQFQLNSSVEVLQENDSYYLQYSLPQNGVLQKEELKDWLAILLYFEEPTTIKELYDELCEDEDFLKEMNKNELKNKLISFVMDKLLLLEILTVHL
ncbi:DUF6734 family protein [Tenacibaculum agarivorans]|uniref:DUF6734 family protein n=1 Tax=Tenacibaculum agarivorans TaxID=1908389 RepID=UPI00094BC1F9|nr:DUF6734 family protein [Tenacibaculum agarivorans]